jgi:hypothetical protein
MFLGVHEEGDEKACSCKLVVQTCWFFVNFFGSSCGCGLGVCCRSVKKLQPLETPCLVRLECLCSSIFLGVQKLQDISSYLSFIMPWDTGNLIERVWAMCSRSCKCIAR